MKGEERLKYEIKMNRFQLTVYFFLIYFIFIVRRLLKKGKQKKKGVHFCIIFIFVENSSHEIEKQIKERLQEIKQLPRVEHKKSDIVGGNGNNRCSSY